MTELRVLPHARDEAITQTIDMLSLAGLQVVRSFDPHTAFAARTGCICPHHGTSACNCQMAVLLVHGSLGPPATLVAHSHDGWTWLSLVDDPDQRPGTELAKAIRAALGIQSHLHASQSKLPTPVDGRSEIVARLATAEGHLRAVGRMAANGDSCEEVLHQLGAVQAALQAVACQLLACQFERSRAIILNSPYPAERQAEIEQLMALYRLALRIPTGRRTDD